MARELKDIELKEVSLVSRAANKKKKYLFFKQEEKPVASGSKKLKKEINIVIDSDGTVGGTKVAVNGEELKDLRDFSFSSWNDGDASKAVACSYSKFVETEDGFSRSETFYLSKGDFQMDAKVKRQLEEYFGKDTEVDFEKAEGSDVIAKSLEAINEYRGDFPDDLKKAVGVIAKQASLCVLQKAEEQEGTKTKQNETDAEFLVETLKKIQDALTTLKGILPKLEEGMEESKKTEVGKAIEELTKSIEQLEKNKGDASKSELTEILAELSKRLEVVEKGTGVKKGIEGQDNDEGTSEKKWPSLSG